MRRFALRASVAVLALLSWSPRAHAQATPATPAPPDSPAVAPPATTPAPSAPGVPAAAPAAAAPAAAAPAAESTAEAPTSRVWVAGYAQARAKLVTGEFAEAAGLFAELERGATNPSDRLLAHEQWALADEWSRRQLVLARRSDVPETRGSGVATDHRSTDEIVSLYTNSVVYGIGTGIFIAVDAKASSPAGVTAPLILGTAASVGTVVALDWGRGFRYGVPQSIVSGMYLGLEEGIFWSVFANTGTSSSGVTSAGWDGPTTATFIWGASTLGAVGGGIIAHSWGTSPGRAAFVGSSGLWLGMVSTFGTAALLNNSDGHAAVGVGGVGLTLGAVGGGLLASSVSPSIWRVRLLDTGGVVGGLLGLGIYGVVVNQNQGDGRLASGLATLGMATGIGTAWWLTSSMEHDYPAERGTDKGSAMLRSMVPTLAPATRGSGLTLGVAGTL